MALPITATYAALLAIVGIALSMGVGAARGKTKVSLGDGGEPLLIVRNRRHMNFVENVPMALILIGLIEANGGGATLLHSLGGVLLAARIIHPFGLDIENMAKLTRFVGAMATMLVILVSAGWLLWNAFGR